MAATPLVRSAIIIGGGPGGLATAIAFRKVGIQAVVYEREAALPTGGAALSLAPNAVHCLDWLGLGDTVRAAGHHIGWFGFRNYGGDDLFRFDMKAHLEKNADGLPYIVLPRVAALSLLHNALPEGTVIFGKNFQGYRKLDTGGMEVRFEDGTTANGDLVVGADGLHSAVRRQMLGEEEPPEYVGYTVWRAISEEYAFPKMEDVHMIVTGPSKSEGMRLFCADMGGNRYYWFFAKLAPERERDASKEEAKQKILKAMSEGGWHEDFIGLIENTKHENIDRRDIFVRPPLESWAAPDGGNVVLLGDAAHPMTPEVGQGAAMSIEDAKVLANMLSAPEDPASTVADVLTEFSNIRIPRTTAVAGKARFNGRLMSMVHPLMVWGRTVLVRNIGPKMLTKQTFIWAHKA